MLKTNSVLALTLTATLWPVMASAADATAELENRDGEAVGNVEFTQTPNGTLIRASFSGLPAGIHALHVHETGRCEGSFDSAGGHYAPLDQGHGILDGDGIHAGDLPNIHVAESAPLQVQYMSRSLLLGDTLLDSNGAAVVLHRHADDYQSNPAGAAGPRIACGVISRIDRQGS